MKKLIIATLITLSSFGANAEVTQMEMLQCEKNITFAQEMFKFKNKGYTGGQIKAMLMIVSADDPKTLGLMSNIANAVFDKRVRAKDEGYLLIAMLEQCLLDAKE